MARLPVGDGGEFGVLTHFLSSHVVIIMGSTHVERTVCVHVWSGVKRSATRNTNLVSHIHFPLFCFPPSTPFHFR